MLRLSAVRTVCLFFAAVFTTFLHAQQSFETMPSGWSTNSGLLSISPNHYKLDTQSLRWDWTSGSVLTISNPGIPAADVTNTARAACDFWLWNGTAIPGGVLLVEFMNGTNLQYSFKVYLDYVGWRHAVRSFTYDMKKETGATSTITSVKITAPATGNGSFYFDALRWSGTNPERIVTGPNADVKGTNSDNTNYATMAIAQDIAATPPTAEELADLETARNQWLTSAKGGQPSAGSVANAWTSYDTMNIVDDPVSGIRGNVVGAEGTDEIFSWAGALARDYAIGTSSTASESGIRMERFARHLLDQGQAGHSDILPWGTGAGGYGYRTLPKALILATPTYDAATRARLWEYFRWLYFMGDYWTIIKGGNTDDIHTAEFQILGAILFLTPNDTEAVRWLKAHKRYLEGFLVPSNGGSGGIKIDGLGFHHSAHYNAYMYALPTLSDTLYTLRGTRFQVDQTAYQRLSNAFLVMMRMSADGAGTQLGYYGNSLCGRHPFSTNLPFDQGSLQRLGEWGGMISGQAADSIIARAYNRRYGENNYALFKPYGTENPDGFYQYNYSPLGIYRRGNWVASIHSTGSYFWSTEIYATDNQYGRYQAYGALEILYHGGRATSGQDVNGWDWNYVPGTTTIALPWSKLVCPGDREDVRSQINFSGALGFQDGQSGMYASNFQEKNLTNHNSTFVWRKSWFAFDNEIVCLGSDIANNDAANSTITTLFQGKLATQSTGITLDGSAVTAFPHSSTVSGSSAHWLLDACGTGYITQAGAELKLSRATQTTPNEADNGTTTTGDFARAWLNHSTSPAGASYEYAVIPATNATAMASAASVHSNATTKPYEVIQRNTSAHIVKWKADGKTGYAIFNTTALPVATQNAGLLRSVQRPCLVMAQVHADHSATMSIVDPDLNFVNTGSGDESVARTFDLTINGQWILEAPAAGSSIVSGTPTTTTIRVTTQHGSAVHLHLLRNVIPGVQGWANIGSDWNDPVNWGSNWGGDLPANDLVTDTAAFGAVTVQPVLASGYSVKGIALSGGTTLSGAGNLNLGAGGVTADGSSNTFSLSNITLGAAQTWAIGSGTFEVSSVIGGAGSALLDKSGAGTLILSGTNTYLGGTTVNGGILEVSNDQSAANGGWTINAGTTANWKAGSVIAVAATKSVTFANSSNAHTLNVAGMVNNAGSLLLRAASNLNLESGGNWTQGGSMTLLTANSFTSAQLTVKSGAAFTYTGASVISLSSSSGGNSGNGTLALSGGSFTTGQGFSNVTSNGTGSAYLTFSNSGILKLSANVATLATTAGRPFNIQIGAGGGIVDTDGYSTTIPQGITNISGQTGSLAKRGSGTLTLSGPNTYTGATTIESGVLAVTGTLGASAVEVKSAAKLQWAGNVGSSITIRSGGRLAIAVAATSAAQVARNSSGSLTFDSGNILDLTASSLPATGTYLLATASSISGAPGTVNLPAGVTGNVAIVGNQLQLTVSSTSAYQAWISGYNVGAKAAANDDADGDGLPNAVEFAMGMNPATPNSTGIQSQKSGGNLLFTFPRVDAAEGTNVQFLVEAGDTLQTWTQSYQIGDSTATSSAGVSVTENGSAADTITVTIPANASSKIFARLKVVVGGS